MSILPPTSPQAHDSRPGKSSKTKIIGFVILVMVAVAAVAYFVKRGQTSMATMGRRQMMTPYVAVAPVEQGQLKVYINAIGNVVPLNVITVRSRVDGELIKIHFTEGQLVKAGDLLAEIDDRAYRASLAQAEGQLTRDKALLKNAKLDLERYMNAEEAVTQQQIDTAKATVAEYEGTVQADQGAVDNDRLQLGYCRITAPISGRLGLKLVDQGNLVQASSSTGLVVLTQEQPISTLFSIPEDSLPLVRKALAAGKKLPVEVFDGSNKNHLTNGVLSALNNQIDLTTGTVQIRAQFTNDDHSLFPNQFVNIRLLVDTQENALLIPSSAIQIGAQQSRSVFVVKSDNTVERRAVTTGLSEGEKTAILTGLSAGENIVLDSLDKLQNGSPVVPRSKNTSADTPAPAAPDANRSQHRRKSS